MRRVPLSSNMSQIYKSQCSIFVSHAFLMQ